MGERANGLCGVSRQNASGLPMLVGTDPAASASRVRHTSRRASLYRRNGDVFARLDKIATPSKVLSQLAWRAAPSPVGACPQRLAGSVPVVSGSVPGGGRGLSPRGERTAYAVRTGQITALWLASAGSVPIGSLGVCPRGAWTICRAILQLNTNKT